MSSGEVALKFDDVQDAAASVRSVAANIYEQLDELQTAVNRVAAEWSGSAASNYHYQQARWSSASSDLHSLLLQIASQLEATHGSFTTTESSMRDLWSS
ncbi:MAG TPA: WXG100 family type VII secretion target [Actinocrinis sp.]